MGIFSRFRRLAGCAVLSLGVVAGVAAPASAESILDRVVADNKIKVGVMLNVPPFGMKSISGEPEGFDVDVANLIAEKLGVELEIVDTTSVDRIPNLRSGKVDIIVGTFTGTPERAKVVSFSEPYVTALLAAFAVKTDSGIESAGDLTTKRIAVTKGTTQDLMVAPEFPEAEILRFDTEAAALFALAQGQVDAFICDGNVLNYQATINPEIKVIVDEKFSKLVEYQRLGVPRGDQEWLNWVNMFVFDLNATGTSYDLYEKWFNAGMPAPLIPNY
ncbi:transporter substrate-binding domain-containing protein [Shinella daejeonensis]|uniref:transporter substrate-binding domain-containing protein n=1 Tax=Shinella daejeonensis TaxID=659017 RepID=UPI0020C7BB23|nr:transporter substrate-binding domain-containing protein [Shinella daejeonensis]MCP8896567.1 transporter substrate-binding domain-containing protein [Shinella daejeonensis]